MSFFNIHVVNVINQMVWRCTDRKGVEMFFRSSLQYTEGVKKVHVKRSETFSVKKKI